VQKDFVLIVFIGAFSHRFGTGRAASLAVTRASATVARFQALAFALLEDSVK
jgi:hypothetical protein